jgi:ABC-2 type transport system permease protein
MTRAALFLITHNLKNRITRWFMRLRQPRYAAGAVLAGLYLWTFLFRRHAAIRAAAMGSGPFNDLLAIVISFIVLVLIVGAWALPSEAPGLLFSEAEIQFFFPAPITRRQLLAYKVLRTQIQILFSALIISFFAFRGSHYLGMWISLAVLDVYMTFVAFARARLKLAGIGWWWRLAAVAAAFIALIALVARQLRGNSKVILDVLYQPKMAGYVSAVTAIVLKPPLGTILYVPRLFGQMVYAADGWMFLRNGAILLAAALMLFFLTVQFDVAFEDASIVASQRALARRARVRSMRSGTSSAAVHRFPPPFRLAERGRPEVAIIWKNLIGAMRLSSFPIIALVLPVTFVAAAGIFRRQGDIAAALGMGGLITTGLFALIGPQAVRSDLRLDLLRLDVVKTFPLSAEALLAAELAAPLLVLAIFEVAMLAVSLALLNFAKLQASFVTTSEFAVCALIFIVPISAIQLLIQNGAMILLPAWSISADPARGLTALGQRLLLALGNILTLAIALFPAGVVLILSLQLIPRLLGHSPPVILIATLPAAAILIGEIAIAHKVLASQFEEIDIANDLESATP